MKLKRKIGESKSSFAVRVVALERNELQAEIDEYRKALQKVIDDSHVGVVPKSHLDHIEKLLNRGE